MSKEVWDVVVIGAGFSGLVAARDLEEKGHRVLVLEGRDRPGGRTWYRKFSGTDHLIEIGGTWFSAEYMPDLMEEVNRYNIGLVGDAPRNNYAFVTGGERRTHAPIPPEEFAALEPAIVALREAVARVPNGRLVDGEDYSDLDVPVNQWPPFVGLPKASQDFVYAWASMYGACAENEVSVMHFAMMIGAFGGDISALQYGQTHRFAHGTKELIDAILNDFAGSVRYSVRVQGIEQGDLVEVHTDAGVISSKRVICTVPLNSLHRLKFSPDLPAQAAQKAKKGMAAKGIKSWSLCRNVPEGFLGLGWGVGLEWAMPVYHFEDGTSIVCGFGFDKSRVDPSDMASVQKALEQYLPDVEVLAVDTHDWVNDEFSDGTAMIVDPGWISSGDYRAFEKPHGGVYFAGTDHSAVWTGWISGAVTSGRAVAAQVASDLTAP